MAVGSAEFNHATAGELAGLTAVVTGSSSGIGAAIATELAAAGAAVVIHGFQHRENAERLCESIHRDRRDATTLLADLGNPSEVATFADRAWNWKGRVDLWVNNAGADVLTGEAAEASFEEKLDLLWRVDVLATMRLSRIIGERMRAEAPNRKQAAAPAILNIGWDQAEIGMAGDSGEMFATIKGAVMAFTRSLAKSLAPEVRVNCLAPGWIRTAWGESASDFWQQRARREALLQRWGTPADVARMARFLVSPQAEFITGQIIAVNGGFRASSQ